MSREPIEMTAQMADDLDHGRLEMTCVDCGRWSAADWWCSWCFRPMVPAVDWYHNPRSHDAAAQRAARMPKVAPANPPSEYRVNFAHWPKAWGKFPGEIRGPRAPQEIQTPL